MNTKIFAIYDIKATAYMQPFFATNAALALRSFATNVNSPESIFNKYPDDFVLYEIGSFDDQKGVLEDQEHNQNLGSARDYIEAPNHNDTEVRLVK